MQSTLLKFTSLIKERGITMGSKTTQIMKLNLHGYDYRIVRNNETGEYVLTVSEAVWNGTRFTRTKHKINTYKAPENAVIGALRDYEWKRS